MEPASPGQYFERRPAVASSRRTVRLTLPDLTLDLVTDRGVFSAEHVDEGTKVLLLEAPPPPVTGDVLDLGCGYGPIAVTLARRSPQATVWAVDVNERAVALCAENAAGAGAENVRSVVVDPEGRPVGAALPDDLRFAALYSNPPIRIGKAALHPLLRRWLSRLAPGGVAYLVVHKHLGSDSLARWLTTEGWPTERLVSRRGFRILAVTAPAAGAS